MKPSVVDVCVIGGGPAGLTVARRCAEGGLDVEVLEVGRQQDPTAPYALIQRSAVSAHHRDGPDGEFNEGAANPWTVSGLGGGMARFAGIFLRMREADFHRDSTQLQGADLDPAWPIRYEELRTHYDSVEETYGIARVDETHAGGPPSMSPVMPPHPHGPLAQRVVDAAVDLGLNCLPTPLAVNSVPYRGRPACNRRRTCNEDACLSGARADAVHELRRSPHAELKVAIRTSVWVRRLICSGVQGEVVAAESVSRVTGRARSTHAKVFVVACNAVQSAALLIRSDLGNETDMVGRGLSVKASGYVHARFPPASEPAGSVDFFSTMLTADFYERLPQTGALGGLMYEAQMSGRRRGEWRLHCVVSDAPQRENRVLLRRPTSALEAQRGGGVVMQYRQHPDDRRRLEELLEAGAALVREAGGAVTSRQLVGNSRGAAHLLGTCRAGHDPMTSVVAADGRIHGSTNTYVVDGGFFPHATATNPTMTIIANAQRIADQILVLERGQYSSPLRGHAG